MTHHSFADKPDLSLERMEAAVGRAHELRSRAVTGFFKQALDRKHRALSVMDSMR